MYASVEAMFSRLTRDDVKQPTGRGALNAAAIVESSNLLKTDIFVDIGSGSGSVVAQVALQTTVSECVGLEVRKDLADISAALLSEWVSRYSRLAIVKIVAGDIANWNNICELKPCTILFSNNQVFDPAANLSLQAFICASTALRTVVVQVKFCYRCSNRCTDEFCLLWTLQKLLLLVFAGQQPQKACLYILGENMTKTSCWA